MAVSGGKRSSSIVSIFAPEALATVTAAHVEGLLSPAPDGSHGTPAMASPSYEEQMARLARQMQRLKAEQRQGRRPQATRTAASAVAEEPQDATSDSDSEEPESDDDQAWQDLDPGTEAGSDAGPRPAAEEGVTAGTRRQPQGARLYFQNREKQQWYAIYKDILPSRASEVGNTTVAQELEALGRSRQQWAFFMCAGGHFAAAVVENGNVLLHKCFHRYVVRAKRGTVQSARDNKSGTSAPKSAGATLRRYNEAQLVIDIQTLLQHWAPQLAECQVIFHRTSINNRHFLFRAKGTKDGDKSALGLLHKDDARVRAIPFPTGRPTLREICRIYAHLSSIEALAEAPDFVLESAGPSGEDGMPADVSGTQAPAATMPVVARATPATPPLEPLAAACLKGDLRSVARLLQVDEALIDRRLEARKNEELEAMHDFTLAARPPPSDLRLDALAEEEKGLTCLHVASKRGYLEIVHLLLEHGASPCVHAEKQLSPYDVAKSKEVRNVFRRFMAAHPARWDYAVAHIPSPLTLEMERKQNEAQAAKDKAETTPLALKYASASTVAREQRAAAALARLRDAPKPEAGSRAGPFCALCGKPAGAAGQPVFRRLEFEYCSMDCLKRHKQALLR